MKPVIVSLFCINKSVLIHLVAGMLKPSLIVGYFKLSNNYSIFKTTQSYHRYTVLVYLPGPTIYNTWKTQIHQQLIYGVCSLFFRCSDLGH